MKNGVNLGSRIICDGCVATVLYKGPVPPTEGEWLGVEWDDSNRGKHNGTKDGVTYFKTSSITSGSFIRAKKADVGISFYAAICDRYGLIEGEISGVNEEKIYITGGNKVTAVELIGFDKVNEKQSQLDKLEEVCLRRMKIYGSASEKLSDHFPKLKILDLSNNLIPSWEELSKITCQLPSLHSLNISENRLRIPQDKSLFINSFSCLKTLYMNRMNINFTQVLHCSEMWSNLEELHICFLGLKELSMPCDQLKHLTLLNLEANPIGCWDEVLKLSSLISLRTLILNDTSLEKIYFPGKATETPTFFPNLQSISLNRNKLSEWSSINELNKLAHLKELRMNQNPLCSVVNEETLRQLFIAKLGRLKICNRTEVTEVERRDAERDYIKRFGLEWVAAGSKTNPIENNLMEKFIEEHPRYLYLVEKHGAAETSEMKQANSTLKDSLISVKIECPQDSTKKKITKKIPSSMTVQKVKTLVQRLVKADISTLKLSYISKGMDGPEKILDNEYRQISYYSLENGDTILAKW